MRFGRGRGTRVRTRRDMQTEAEIAFHLEMRAREFESHGCSPDEARAAAAEAFGTVPEIQRECAALNPEMRPRSVEASMTGIGRDIRYALRSARRRPLFFVTAVLTIALGIGPNTAIFSIFEWVHFGSAAGVVEPDELRTLRYRTDTNGAMAWTHVEYEALRDGMRMVSDLVAFETWPLHIAVGAEGRAERLTAEVVAGDYFGLLGLVPDRGRFFSPEELQVPGEHPVLVVSHAFWTRHFGDGAAAGEAEVMVNGHRFTIIGVAPPRFHGAIEPGEAEAWVPVAMHRVVLPTYPANAMSSTRAGMFFQMLGRATGSAEVAAIQDEASAIMRNLPDVNPRAANRDLIVQASKGAVKFSWDEDRLGQSYRTMTIVVGLVLLIACANLTNLMLARSSSRRREVAVRLALGVSGRRLFQENLVEALVIAAAGAGFGLVLAQGMIGLFRGSSIAANLPAIGDVPFDVSTLLFTAAVAVVSAVLFGTLPGLVNARQDPAAELRGGRGTVGVRGWSLRGLLAGAQVAVSIVLLVSAGLFLRTMQNLAAIEYGFDVDRVLTFALDPGTNGYEDNRVLPFYRELIDRLREEPSVAGATVAWRNVFDRVGGDAGIRDPSQHAPDEFPVSADLNAVGSDYFSTLGVELIEGREFTDDEVYVRNTRTLVINQALAEALWPGQSALGRQVELTYPRDTYEIVGIVENVQMSNPLDPPEPMVYGTLAYSFIPTWSTISVRARGTVVEAATIERLLQSLDPTLPVYLLATVGDTANRRFAEFRFAAKLTGIVAALALVLALIGLYGVVAFSVAQRHREFGVRLALGGGAGNVVGLVIRHALTIGLVGAAVGVAGAVGMGRVLESRLFGVAPIDPVTLLAAVATLVVGVVVASAVPARQAIKVDPIATLRME